MAIHWHTERHDCVKSTQDILKQRVQSGASEGLVIRADEQSGGYGRHGRAWVSAPGNVYCSFLLKPDCKIRDVGQLALVIGVSLAQAVRGLVQTPDQVSLKWPNDVLIGGKKCAGILIETDGAGHVMIGIGLNIVAAPDIGTPLNAYSDREISADEAFDKLLEQIALCYNQWIVGDFDDVRAAWLELGHKEGTPVSVKIGERTMSGTFYDLDITGAMVLRTPDGEIKTITAGEVFV